MSINIVYHSTTGNVKRFLDNVKPYAEGMGFIIKLFTIEEAIRNNVKFHLFTPTRGFGEIPHLVENFLNVSKDRILSVSGSGNRNWGANYCKACFTISEIFKVPVLHTIELSGTQKDTFIFTQVLIDFLKNNKDEKLHST